MKKLALVAVAVAAFAGVLVPGVASAASSPVVGTFTIADNGQGGWVGGSLLADGSVGGGGAVSFSTPAGQFIERETSGSSWGPGPVPGTIFLSLNLVGVSKLAPPTDNFSVVLPVTGTPIKVTDPSGGTTIIRVRLF